jgi:hypothetical protein
MPSATARTGSFVLALACATAAARAQPAEPRATLVVRVVDPAPVSFEATALGRATHHLRMALTNSGTRPVQLEALSFRVRPMKDGVLFSCSDPQSKDERWPATLDPGASFTLSRDVSCDTPLPGRYDVELRARPRGGPDEAERTYGSFAMHIEPGANPPVRIPWDASLHAAASGTKELRPSKDPNKARIVVALVNGTRNAVTLAPVHAMLRISRRGSTVAPCALREADLPFSGSLAPGRSQTLPMPVGCDLSAEAVYDVDVSISNPSGAKVHLATHAIRVGVLPPPPPRPEDAPTGKIIGGM